MSRPFPLRLALALALALATALPAVAQTRVTLDQDRVERLDPICQQLAAQVHRAGGMLPDALAEQVADALNLDRSSACGTLIAPVSQASLSQTPDPAEVRFGGAWAAQVEKQTPPANLTVGQLKNTAVRSSDGRVLGAPLDFVDWNGRVVMVLREVLIEGGDRTAVPLDRVVYTGEWLWLPDLNDDIITRMQGFAYDPEHALDSDASIRLN